MFYKWQEITEIQQADQPDNSVRVDTNYKSHLRETAIENVLKAAGYAVVASGRFQRFIVQQGRGQ